MTGRRNGKRKEKVTTERKWGGEEAGQKRQEVKAERSRAGRGGRRGSVCCA